MVPCAICGKRTRGRGAKGKFRLCADHKQLDPNTVHTFCSARNYNAIEILGESWCLEHLPYWFDCWGLTLREAVEQIDEDFKKVSNEVLYFNPRGLVDDPGSALERRWLTAYTVRLLLKQRCLDVRSSMDEVLKLSDRSLPEEIENELQRI